MLRSAGTWVGLALLSACAPVPRQTQFMEKVGGVELSAAALRDRVYELGRRESALVEQAVAEIYAATSDPRARATALSWGLAAVPQVEEATLLTDPLVALGDLWALALQTDEFARRGPGREAFGEGAVALERAAAAMIRECEAVAATVFGEEGVADKRERVARWAAEHPITSATFARPSASAAWPLALEGEERRALRALVASTDTRLTEMSERLSMMNRTLLVRARWTTNLLIQDTLGAPNVAGFLDLSAAQLEEVVARERAAVFREVAAERAAIFGELAGQREAITADAQRIFRRVDERVAEAMTELDRQRVEIFAQIDAERAAVAADARALVTRLLVGAALVGAALIVLAALAVWLLRHAGGGPRELAHGRR